MFPVYLRENESDPLPKDAFAYLVGQNGMFLLKRNAVFQAVVGTPAIDHLAKIETGAEYLLPLIPTALVQQMARFFRAIHTLHQSEAILLMSYHPKRKTFRLDAPEQSIRKGVLHLDYVMPERAPEGFIFIGTVHSHADGSAFHSGTDEHDEAFFDGVHLTFGKVNQPLVEIVASLAIGKERFTLAPQKVLDGLTLKNEEQKTERKVPTWKGKVKKVSVYSTVSTISGFAIDIPADVPNEELDPPTAWFEKVKVIEPPKVEYVQVIGHKEMGDWKRVGNEWRRVELNPKVATAFLGEDDDIDDAEFEDEQTPESQCLKPAESYMTSLERCIYDPDHYSDQELSQFIFQTGEKRIFEKSQKLVHEAKHLREKVEELYPGKKLEFWDGIRLALKMRRRLCATMDCEHEHDQWFADRCFEKVQREEKAILQKVEQPVEPEKE